MSSSTPTRIHFLISPNEGGEWIGTFSPAYGSPPAITGVFATPHQDRCCVVSAGQAFIIDVNCPAIFSEVKCFPVTAVVQATAVSRIAFVDFTQLVAWDGRVEVWNTGRVSLDGIEIIEQSEQELRCRGWDLEYFDFTVDLRDGSIIEGYRELSLRDPPL